MTMYPNPVHVVVGDSSIRQYVTEAEPIPMMGVLTFRFRGGNIFSVKRVAVDEFEYSDTSTGPHRWNNVWDTIGDAECLTLFTQEGWGS